MNKLLTTFIWCLLVPIQGIGQTYVSGGIFSNTNWTVSGNPYIVTGNVIVMTGVTLTIQPGVTVFFDNGMGLEVRGDLIANGTSTDSILFIPSSTNPTPGIWEGLDFWNDCNLNYIKIMYADLAIDIINTSQVHISNSYFGFNNKGFEQFGYNNTETIDNTIFEENIIAIQAVIEAAHISNCLFINNGIGLGQLYDTLLSGCSFFGHTNKAVDGGNADIIGNHFANNNIGLRIMVFDNINYEQKNNTITNNQIGVQIRGDISSTPNTGFFNNSICDNYLYNMEVNDNVSVYVQNNCWCTTDSVVIANSIHDAYDNLSLGIAFYSPFQTNCATGSADNLTETNFKLYPNPVSSEGILYTNLNLLNTSVSIYDITGREQLRQELPFSGEVNVSMLPPGMYLVELVGETVNYVQKVIRQ